MSSMLAAIREAMAGFPGEIDLQEAAPSPAASATASPAKPAAALDGARLVSLLADPRLANSQNRQNAAARLLAEAPDMTNESVVSWVVKHIPEQAGAAAAGFLRSMQAEHDRRVLGALGMTGDSPVLGAGQAMPDPSLKGQAGAAAWDSFRKKENAARDRASGGTAVSPQRGAS